MEHNVDCLETGMWKHELLLLYMECSDLRSVAIAKVVLLAQEGKLLVRSMLGVMFKSMLSKTEQSLFEDPRLRFWLRLLE